MKKIMAIYLICLAFFVGCSSNDSINDMEQRLSKLEKDIEEIKITINTLSQGEFTTVPTESSNLDFNDLQNNNMGNDQTFDYAQQGIFCLDDMSVEEICEIVKTLLQDFPKENTSMDTIKEHYNSDYKMKNVNVNFTYNNKEQSKFEIEYQNNQLAVIHTDYIDAVQYTFPLSVQDDNTLKYNRISSYHPKSLVKICIYADGDKATNVYKRLVEVEKDFQNSDEVNETNSQRSYYTRIANSEEYNVNSTVILNHTEADYYEIAVTRNFLFFP